MKIRTDFVTNSSSSSFIAFTIKSKAIVDYFKSLGFELESNDTISSDDMIITPNGEEFNLLWANEEGELSIDQPDGCILDWLLDVLYNNGCSFDIDYNEFQEQKEKLEKSIKSCDIVAGVANTEDSTSFCTHITVNDGKKTTATLTDAKWKQRNNVCLGVELSKSFSFAEHADKYGDVKVEKI